MVQKVQGKLEEAAASTIAPIRRNSLQPAWPFLRGDGYSWPARSPGACAEAVAYRANLDLGG